MGGTGMVDGDAKGSAADTLVVVGDRLGRDPEVARAAEAGAEMPGAAMLKDEAACIRCSMCAIRCPTGAITMERYQFTESWAEAPGSGKV